MGERDQSLQQFQAETEELYIKTEIIFKDRDTALAEIRLQVRQLSEVSRNNGPKHAGAVNPKKMEPKDFSGDVLKFKRWREDVEDWMKMKFPGIEKLMKKFREKMR